MDRRLKSSLICPYRLNESYDILYELQQRLKIKDEYLMSVNRDLDDDQLKESLEILLKASKEARDNIITWYLKQTLVELHATVSLLTAKIKFIEYKLGLCEGIDLHQACSLSLVDFCNILADMTILNVSASERKTMHKVSVEAGIPIWLSHYRNQICHIPSESPCISILVPLVVRSLDYLKDNFWLKVIDRDAFNAQKCISLVETISGYVKFVTVNQHVEIKRGTELSKKEQKIAKVDKIKCKSACIRLRRSLEQNSEQVIDIILNYIMRFKPRDKERNCGLILEQVILSRNIEKFINRLLDYREEKSHDSHAIMWLYRLILIIGSRSKNDLRSSLRSLNMHMSVKIKRFCEVSPLKCTRIAYRILEIDKPIVTKLIHALRYKLLPMLGKEKTILLMKLTCLAKGKRELSAKIPELQMEN